MKNHLVRNLRSKKGNSQKPGRYEKRVDLIQESIKDKLRHKESIIRYLRENRDSSEI